MGGGGGLKLGIVVAGTQNKLYWYIKMYNRELGAIVAVSSRCTVLGRRVSCITSHLPPT
jgi:hypothetical protein